MISGTESNENKIPRHAVTSITKNYAMYPNAVMRSPEVSPYAKVIFGILISYTPPAYPSYSILCKRSTLSKNTVIKAIRELCRRNLISFTKKHEDHDSNTYYINWDDSTWMLAGSRDEPSSPSEHDWCTPHTSNGSSHAPQVVQEVNTNKTNLNKSNSEKSINNRFPIIECLKDAPLIEEYLKFIPTEMQLEWETKLCNPIILKDVVFNELQKLDCRYPKPSRQQVEDRLRAAVTLKWNELVAEAGGPIKFYHKQSDTHGDQLTDLVRAAGHPL